MFKYKSTTDKFIIIVIRQFILLFVGMEIERFHRYNDILF